jgi:hypothetical protein
MHFDSLLNRFCDFNHEKGISNLFKIKMKTRVILLLILSSVILSCEKENLCNEGYVPHESNGQTFCIPEYLSGQRLDPKQGNTYYHENYGVVTIQNGIWKDKNNVTIKNIDK